MEIRARGLQLEKFDPYFLSITLVSYAQKCRDMIKETLLFISDYIFGIEYVGVCVTWSM